MGNLKFYDTHCCALEEIDGLAEFPNNPKGAMVDFCRTYIGKRVEWKVRVPKGDFGSQGALYSFYFFTAAVYRKGTGYGVQFAEFIKENKLGEVITTPVMTNMAFHTDHGNQVWIWMPDVKALTKWWTENKPKKDSNE